MVKKMLPIRKKITPVDETTVNVDFTIVGPCFINRAIFEFFGAPAVNGDVGIFGLSTTPITGLPNAGMAGIIGMEQWYFSLNTNGAVIIKSRSVIEMYGYPLQEGKKLYAFFYMNTDAGTSFPVACLLNWAK